MYAISLIIINLEKLPAKNEKKRFKIPQFYIVKKRNIFVQMKKGGKNDIIRACLGKKEQPKT